MIAGSGVGVHRCHGLTVGVLNRYITAPCACAHGNLHRTGNGDLSLEVVPAVLIGMELAGERRHRCGGSFLYPANGSIISNGNPKLEGCLVRCLVRGQQVAVGEVNLEGLYRAIGCKTDNGGKQQQDHQSCFLRKIAHSVLMFSF